MKVNVLFTPESAEDLYFTGKATVVLDILRASNTIITAVGNEAKEIIPVASVDSAVKISKGLFGGSTILGGERNTIKIEGFHLGNSPAEYTSEKVKGKTIIFFTTNGTKAILKARLSANLFIGAFINISAVTNRINKLNQDVEILCAGNPGSFSIEDAVCAGMIVSELKKLNSEYVLSDSSRAASILYKSCGSNLLETLSESEHGKLLLKNGFKNDLEFCSQLNTTEVIPYLSGNVIKLLSGK